MHIIAIHSNARSKSSSDSKIETDKRLNNYLMVILLSSLDNQWNNMSPSFLISNLRLSCLPLQKRYIVLYFVRPDDDDVYYLLSSRAICVLFVVLNIPICHAAGIPGHKWKNQLFTRI